MRPHMGRMRAFENTQKAPKTRRKQRATTSSQKPILAGWSRTMPEQARWCVSWLTQRRRGRSRFSPARAGGHPMAELSPEMESRLLAKISPEPNSGCWLWEGALSGGGYGRIFHDGKARQAHRVAYEMFSGPIPEGLELDHLCRVRSCCNPAHLEPVTRAENMLRSPIACGKAKTHCPHGHAYTAENTLIDNRGARVCRECDRKKSRARNGRRS